MALGDWQFHRAESGNALSWAYTFEWPIFAVFASFSGPRRSGTSSARRCLPGVAAGSVELPAGAAAGTAPPAAASGQDAAGDDAEDAELAAYNAYLARLTSEARGHGRWHGFR